MTPKLTPKLYGELRLMVAINHDDSFFTFFGTQRSQQLEGLHLTTLGRKVSGSMVYKSHAIKDRTNEEGGKNCSATQAAYSELVQGKKGVFQWNC